MALSSLISEISKKSRTKKSQVWYTDFMIGLLIFVIALVIYYEYAVNLARQEKGLLDELLADAKAIASSLISEGYPADWGNGTVERIGITDGRFRIDEQKLGAFSGLSYKDTRNLFTTRFDYVVFFMDKGKCLIEVDDSYAIGHAAVDFIEINGTFECGNYGTGNLAVNLDAIKPEKLVSIGRLLVYKDEIVKMVLYVWQ